MEASDEHRSHVGSAITVVQLFWRRLRGSCP